METRKEMTDECPDEFEDRLKDIIDGIEGEVNAGTGLPKSGKPFTDP